MPADPIIAAALQRHYSISELRTFEKAILGAAMNPESLTGEQLDGVSFNFQPKSEAELKRGLENIASAISRADGTSDEPAAIRSRFFNFGSRAME